MSRKVVIVGDSGVGKTSILFRFVQGSFNPNVQPSFGAGFKTKDVAYDDSGERTVKLYLWDTAGQERYNSLTKLYFKGANAAIIVYDITDQESFAKAQRWSDQIDEFQQNDTDSKIDKFMVGNKMDLAMRQEVTLNEVEKYAQTIGACGCFEVSAKDGTCIPELFKEIAKNMH